MTTSSDTPTPGEPRNRADAESEAGRVSDDYSDVAADDVVDDAIEYFDDPAEETPLSDRPDLDEQPPPPNA